MILHSSPTVPENIQKWGDKMKMLMDAEFLKEKLKECGSQKEMAKILPISEKTLRKALRYHKIITTLNSKK